MKQEELEYKRNCPLCSNEITYSTKWALKYAANKNTNCKKCNAIKQFKNLDQRIKEGKAVNGFQGKSHSIEMKDNMSNKIKSLYKNGKLNISGEKNPMFGKTGEKSPRFGTHLLEEFINRYGKIEGNKKILEWKEKISLKSRGENNSMYGKPSPKKSGNGWAGWYKGWYFRSLRELSFMINYIERFNMKWECGESVKYRIQYIDYKGSNRNYFPDFILNSKFMVECKPKPLWKSKDIVSKKNKAMDFCIKNDLIYKLIDPILLRVEKLEELYRKGIIMFNKSSEIKFNNYVTSGRRK